MSSGSLSATSADIPKSLKDALRERRLVPFVGAGISRGITQANTDEPLFPDWTTLLNDAADRVAAEKKEDDAGTIRFFVGRRRLLDAAGEAQKALGNSLWNSFLKEKFDVPPIASNPDSWEVAKCIWHLGSQLVLTTNFDRVLRWTCPDPRAITIWDADSDAEFAKALQAGVSSPTVWHLHGRIDRASTVVLTSEDFKDLYGPKTDYKGQKQALASLLAGKSFLFLGYGLGDEDFTAQIDQVAQAFGEVTGPHFALLKEGTASDRLPRTVLPIFYKDHGAPFAQLMEALVEIAQSGPTFSKSSPLAYFHVSESQQDGVYLFGGRGDKFLEMYDQSIESASSKLDIFALSLNRLRRNHGRRLLELARTLRIRIALLDPQFPVPNEMASLAAIREKEERGSQGDIRRSVAAWYYDVWRPYCEQHAVLPSDPEGPGLFMKLYRVLPTVNLFRADNRLFVGPYLVSVEDHKTPSMVFDAIPHATRHVGTRLFETYQKHFDEIWNSEDTRDFIGLREEEVEQWRKGLLSD